MGKRYQTVTRDGLKATRYVVAGETVAVEIKSPKGQVTSWTGDEYAAREALLKQIEQQS